MARKPRQPRKPRTKRPTPVRPGRRAKLRTLGIAIGAGLAVAAIGVAGTLLIRAYRHAPSTAPPDEVVMESKGPPRPAPRPTSVITFEEGCVSAECHGPMLGRSFVHEAVSELACDACHAPDAGGHVYPVLGSAVSGCTSCHDTGESHAFQHRAMSEDGCLACHDPHGSDAPALLVASTVEQTCERCHPRDRGSVSHPPYADNRCGDCHDPHGADNPTLLVGGGVPENCRICHGPTVDAMQTEAHTHAAIEGSCLGCHDGHTAAYKSLLAAQPRELCVSCHEDVGRQVAGPVSHDAVLKGEQCATCHDPHASDRQAMLRDEQPAICLSCHDEPVKAADGREVKAIGPELAGAAMVHGAVRLGGCSSCHSMHGAEHADLLREIDPTVLVGPFEIGNYALCFACHDKAMADAPGATQFRDGDTNLHGVHLRAGERSAGCADCHAVHAGSAARLVVETIRYQGSQWETPMNFTITADGGRCAPGCHEPLSYSRRPGPVAGDAEGGSR